jgi:N-acetylmuramoyl-L-alanine amidase
VRALGDGRYRIELGGQPFELADGVAFARLAHEVLPLAVEPELRAGRLLVPLAFVSDVLPRTGAGLLYDDEKRELRAFSSGAGRSAAAARTRRAAATLGTAAAPAASAPAPSAPRGRAPAMHTRGRGLANRIVVIDAGHGGPDGGMKGPLGGGPPVLEKHVTLAVALKLRDALRARGVGVAMTRTTDALVPLIERGRIANQKQGDVFVSLHVNAANPAWKDPASARGFETYFLAEAKTEDARRVAEMENESVRFETTAQTAGNDALNFIIHDMAQNEHLRESSELADLVQRRVGGSHPGPNRGVKQAGFRVLVTAFMPAVLVELGYGSNPAEAAYLTSAAGQERLAAAIADATVEYLQQYERRVGGTGR